ncbi:MAG: sulfatase-like hydrolase/transferase, partial [Pirellulales bacterium]|nr:sulfatase-like hydrolase/transferase [Pirellulales bacterium]
MILRFLVILCGSIFSLGSSGIAAERPNLLWITSEDNNVQWVGCYSHPNAHTPCIDQLASDGFRYTNCFATSPVCGPQRSTWITGVHAVSMGTHPMRSRYRIPHGKIPYTADVLRRKGYYCINHN